MQYFAGAGRAIIALGLLGLVVTTSAPSRGIADEREPLDVLIRVQKGTDVHLVAADHGTTVVDGVEASNLHSLRVPRGRSSAFFSRELGGDPRIIGVEPDRDISVQIHVGFDGNRGPGGYRNQRAYQAIHLGKVGRLTAGEGIRVAVLDTGVALEHPDLRDHLIPGYNALDPGSAPRDVPDGVTNAAVGHGTMVAGIVARVAPGARIIPIRVLNGDGDGTLLSVVKGLQYAMEQHAQVINISFGTTQESDLLEEALDRAEDAGMVIVASVGNDGSSVRRFPAAFGGTLGVASIEPNLRKSSFSNFGSDVAVAAPGSHISSTFWDGGYATWSGTSVAVPFVSAAAAIVLSAHPGMKGEEAAESIRETAHSVDARNPAYRGRLGAGIIDVERAVKAAADSEQNR